MVQRPANAAADELIGRYFPVLDHGFVALVDYMGTDECIERAARVSYGAGTRKLNETRGLIRYLRRHKHTTPSEMLEVKLHCAMPIFIARQWIRHRTASVNEQSGRYSVMPLVFYTPDHEQFQPQTKTNRQGRAGEPLSEACYTEALEAWGDVRTAASETYDWMLEQDVARELARIDLPLSTYTQWYWKIDLHNLLHFLTLRVDSHAQWEIQQYGLVIAGMLQRIAPLSYEAWMDYDVNGVRLSRQEWALIQQAWASTSFYVSDEEALAALGSGRECEEFRAKLETKPLALPELDLSKTVDGTHFEERYRQAAERKPEAK